MAPSRATPRHRKRRAIIGGVIVAAFQTVCALAAPSDFLINVWTADNDLPDTSVTAIAQTPDGYLWVGTYNGLARFDGVRFVSFDPLNTPALKHPRVIRLFVDKEGVLWINTYDGSMTAWRNGNFTHEWQGGEVSAVFSRSNRIFFALLPGQLVFRNGNFENHGEWQSVNLAGSTTGSSFREDGDGTLWHFLRDGTLARVKGTNAEVLSGEIGLHGQRVNALAVDGRGRLWVGTDKEIARWTGNRFETQTPTNGEPELNVSFLFCTTNNGCWVIANGKVRRCQDRQWVAEVEEWRGLAGINVMDIGAYEDEVGGTWIRQYGQGLFHAKPDGSTLRISSANNFPGERVSCWLQDHEGNYWIGVDRGGLVRLREKRFQMITLGTGPRPAVSTVCEDKAGNIWIGTLGSGLNRWRDGTLKRFDLPGGADRASFFSAYPDAQGRLWLSAGREDLHVLESEQISQPTNSPHGIKAMLIDREGQIWMGRQNGLSRLTRGVLTDYSPTNGFDRRDIRALAEDRQGSVWIGTGNGELYKYDGKNFTSYRTNDGWQNQAVWALLPDADGTLWVGTFRGGLLRFKDGKFTRYTTRSGLPSDIICQILDDGRGNLWCGSYKGIFRLPKKSLSALDQGEIQSLPCIAYGLYDGLPTLQCFGSYQPSCWRGQDGRLWFATVKGVVSVHPDEFPVNRLAPPVVIEEILVDGKLLGGDLRKTGPSGAEMSRGPQESPLLISPGKHQFEFRYTALSYTAPDKVRFRYRFAGVDDTWVEAGTKRSANYGALRPGDYKFQVIACNNDGVWNEQGAMLAFKVLPYFYETRWFLALVVVVTIGMVAGIVRYVVVRRLRRELELMEQQRAIERDRARIAQDIHDDLGAGLTRILLQSELARRDPPEEVQAHLGQIADTARGLTRTMDEIVWAVDSGHDTLGGLMDYATPFAQEFLQMAGIRCRMDLPAIPPLPVDAESRYHLFLALKEALNNIVKHAQASEVWLRLRVEPDGFTLVVEDNGRGIGEAHHAGNGQRIGSGHGLSNLEKRLRAVGGWCVISSTPGQGTKVAMTVRVPPGRSAIKAMAGSVPDKA